MQSEETGPLVTIDNLSKRYGKGSLVLEDIALQVPAGELVALIGPSGCGKSTLLKLLAGLLEPSGGELRIGGEEAPAARARLSYIFQEPTLLPWLPVRRNIELPLRLRGESSTQRREVAEQLLETVGLEQVSGYYPRQLSGGMKMRVSIARALVHDPQIVLLDEPFTGLDRGAADRMADRLARLAEQGRCCALVTHELAQASRLAQSAVVLLRGRVVHRASGDELERGALEAAYAAATGGGALP